MRQLEPERPGQVPGGERRAIPQVDHPLAGLDPPAQLGGLHRLGRRQVDRGGAAAVDRAHVGVVGRVGVQPGQQGVDVVLLVQGQRRVDPGLLADGGGVTAGRGGRAEAAEPVGRQHRGLGGQLGGQPAHRPELGMGQLQGRLRADQVGAAGGAVEHRPAGEHRPLTAARAVAGVAEDVADVMVGVAGGVQHPHPHPPRLDHLALPHGGVLELHTAAGRQQVARPGAAGELEAAGDVVVVHVGLQHVRDPHPAARRPGRGPGRCRAAGRPPRRPRRRGPGSCGHPGWRSRSSQCGSSRASLSQLA